MPNLLNYKKIRNFHPQRLLSLKLSYKCKDKDVWTPAEKKLKRLPCISWSSFRLGNSSGISNRGTKRMFSVRKRSGSYKAPSRNGNQPHAMLMRF